MFAGLIYLFLGAGLLMTAIAAYSNALVWVIPEESTQHNLADALWKSVSSAAILTLGFDLIFGLFPDPMSVLFTYLGSLVWLTLCTMYFVRRVRKTVKRMRRLR